MKLFNKLASFATIVLICVSAVASAEVASSPLTLQQCTELARKKSDDLLIQSEHQSEAKQKVKEYQG